MIFPTIRMQILRFYLRIEDNLLEEIIAIAELTKKALREDNVISVTLLPPLSVPNTPHNRRILETWCLI